MSEKVPTCCVIIPCFNEQDNVADVIRDICNVDMNLAALIVNDGSNDLTSENAKKTGKALVIDLPINLGVGGAVQTGFKYAEKQNYSYAMKFDGDGQHDPESIQRMIQPLINGQADIVIGSRFIADNRGFKSTFLRRKGIWLLQLLSRLLTGQTVTDPTSGLRAYNRRAIEFMASHYPSFDYPEPEEIILASKNNFRIIEVPVVMRERTSGVSTISSPLSIYFMIKVTLAMLFIYLREPEQKVRQKHV